MKLRMQPTHFVTALFGLFLVGAGIYAYVHLGTYLTSLRETAAVVIDVVYESGTMQKARAHPVVRFTTADGKEVIGRTEKHLKVRAGESVRILYDPAHPERVEVQTLAQANTQRGLFSGLAIMCGLALTLGAIAVDRGFIRLPQSTAPTRVYRKR